MPSALAIPFGNILPFTDAAALWQNVGSFALDANTDKVAFIFQAQSTDIIDSLGFRVHAIADGGTMPTYKISLTGVTNSASDGVIKESGNASATFTPSVAGGYSAGAFLWHALTTGYTPSMGETLALVIERSSGTADASNCITVSTSLNQGIYTPVRQMPFISSDSTGSWGRSGAANIVTAGVKSGSTVLQVNDVRPWKTVLTAQACNSPTEVGFFFTVPSGMFGSAFTVPGIRSMIRGMSTNSNVCMTLYSSPTSSPTVLQQVELDSDTLCLGTTQVAPAVMLFDEATLSSLAPGTEYGIGVVARDVTNDFGLYQLEVASAGDWDGWPFGQNVGYMQRTLSTGYTSTGTMPNESTNFSKTTTKRLYSEIIVGSFTPALPGPGPRIARPIRSPGFRR